MSTLTIIQEMETMERIDQCFEKSNYELQIDASLCNHSWKRSDFAISKTPGVRFGANWQDENDGHEYDVILLAIPGAEIMCEPTKIMIYGGAL